MGDITVASLDEAHRVMTPRGAGISTFTGIIDEMRPGLLGMEERGLTGRRLSR